MYAHVYTITKITALYVLRQRTVVLFCYGGLKIHEATSCPTFSYHVGQHEHWRRVHCCAQYMYSEVMYVLLAILMYNKFMGS